VLPMTEMTQIRRFPPRTPRNIEILAFPGVQLLDITGPLQVFASANQFAEARGLATPYASTVVSSDSQIVTSAGLELVARPLPRESTPVDTLIVPGGSGVDAAMADAGLVKWVRGRARMARRTVSVCTGAFLLAEAGLLNGRNAATHWTRCSELAKRFPDVTVQPDPIFVRDGAVWSSAGVTAGIDLCLALAEQDAGRDVALDIARDLVMFLKRPGSQAQFSATLLLQGSSRFDKLHTWMQENLNTDLSIANLANRCGMSERTFGRRYLEELGLTPARAVERLRVEAARRLLAKTNEPLKVIAARCGFLSEEVLRRSFARLLSVSPRDYRRNWRAD
jgi:transcriptional regulator GlxA family with amidase domain